MPAAKFIARATDGKPGGSPILDQVVADVDSAFRGLGDVVTQAVLIEVKFPTATTDVRVIHKLGYPPKSWEPVDTNAFALFKRSATVNADAKNVLILQASAAPVTATFRIQ